MLKNNKIQTIIIVIILILWYNNYNNYSNKAEISKHNLEVSLDSLKFYKDKNGFLTAEKKAFQGSQQELKEIIKKQDLDISKFKKIKSAVKIKTVTEIKEVKIPFEVKVPCDFHKDLVIINDFYNFHGHVNQLGFEIHSLKLLNKQQVVVGDLKKGFFKTTHSFTIKNSNPYIKVVDANAYTFTQRRKRWSVNTSLFIDLNGRVNAGVGIGYSWITF